MSYYDMAIDAGAATEDERREMAAMFEEEHMHHLQQEWENENQPLLEAIAREVKSNVVIYVQPVRICSSEVRASLS